ncbi:MAG: SDR family oxidoreductase [Clostridia bacterium]|nr:SDR family oxidoreductase [Clostridia bacterium]
MERKTALITGASSGLGKEFSYIFAREGFNLVIAARSEDVLNKIKDDIEERYRVKVKVIALDLCGENASDELFARTEGDGIAVDVLVNNAGFGYQCAFLDSDFNRQKRLIDLNMVCLTKNTYLFGKKMRERAYGRILNISSVAAFSPGVMVSTYYASKAYVLSFSQAVNFELKGSGVSVTALCPGPTATNFAKVANMDKSKAFSMDSTATSVAESGYKALMKQKPVKYHGILTKLGNIGTRLTPRALQCRYTYMVSKSRIPK